LKPWLGRSGLESLGSRKSAMSAGNIHFIEIGDTHDISLLPQDAKAVLNGICSETSCSTNPWGPWYLGLGLGPGCRTGPGTGPGPGLGPAQGNFWPRGVWGCPGGGSASQPDAVWGCPSISGQERNVMGAINFNNINMDGTHNIFLIRYTQIHKTKGSTNKPVICTSPTISYQSCVS
jgi:hypothetical protein